MKKCRNSHGTKGSGRELPEHLAWKILEMWTAKIRHLQFGCLTVLCLRERFILGLAGVRPRISSFCETWGIQTAPVAAVATVVPVSELFCP
jgi:hypothetical protein